MSDAIYAFSLLPCDSLYSISAILLIKNIFISSVYLVFNTALCMSNNISSTASDFDYFKLRIVSNASLKRSSFNALYILLMSSGDGLPVTSYTSY